METTKKLSENNEEERDIIMVKSNIRKHQGWKSMPYILGNETFERLATFGVIANFMVYLRREYHMDTVSAASLINVYFGVSNFAPLLGAFISDAYIGRFSSIAIGSLASFLGLVTLTLTASVPSLKPESCPYIDPVNHIQQVVNSCAKPSTPQLGVLILGLGFLCIGAGCIRPCSIPFGVDQFDQTTEKGRRGISSYYSWYYTSVSLVVVFTQTVVVYVQDSVSWVWGFGIPTCLMFCSILLFFFGTRLYVYVEPEESVFSNIFRVLVAAFKKRHLELPDGVQEGTFYDPPVTGAAVSKLPLTDQLRHIGRDFLIPPGSIAVVTMLTLGIWVPIYDRLVVPKLRKITKHEEGISLLQRMGIGLVLSILSIVIAGLVEQRRRDMANNDHKNMSILWLIPQLSVMGLSEAFNTIAQIEFFNKQFPDNMSSMANSLFYCSVSGANYLSAVLVSMVHSLTGKNGKQDWLTDDLNQGRVDLFYYLLAILGCLNLVYFVVVAKRY
ncbi:hypothetical protein KSS87_017072, partial [Heliosperma pusillum]